MSKLTIDKFIKSSELYLRLTEKDRSALNIDEIDRLIYSENAANSKSSEFSYRGCVVVQLNDACTK
jgi:hypothetical protein